MIHNKSIIHIYQPCMLRLFLYVIKLKHQSRIKIKRRAFLTAFNQKNTSKNLKQIKGNAVVKTNSALFLLITIQRYRNKCQTKRINLKYVI